MLKEKEEFYISAKKYIACFKSKYGHCKYGKQCDKIHFTEKCKMLEKCFEKYCDKRHPQLCYFFEKYKRCKFSMYCSCKKHHNKSQDTYKERYDDICEELEKLKPEVFTLKQNVTNMALE